MEKVRTLKEKKNRLAFNNTKKLFFFLNSNFYKSKFANMYLSYEKVAIIFDIKTLKVNFKCKNLLETLNIFKIPAKEHHLVNRWAADEVLLS